MMIGGGAVGVEGTAAGGAGTGLESRAAASRRARAA